MRLDLEAVAWMRRRLPAAVGVVLLGRERVYAGDWNGEVAAWALDGTPLWTTQQGDRAQHMAGAAVAEPARIAVTCGLELVVLGAADGEVMWRRELEGSADLVGILDDGSQVVVTSSVYDIEHGDYMESACWRFDGDGEELDRQLFDERPWHLRLDCDARAVLGLGRPRCGVMVIDAQGGTEHHPAAAPTLAGLEDDRGTIFGTADGGVMIVPADPSQASEWWVETGDAAIISLLGVDDELVLGLEDGCLRRIDAAGGTVWEVQGSLPAEGLVRGPGPGEAEVAWVVGRHEAEHALWVVDLTDGRTLAHVSTEGRVTAADRRADRLAFGLEQGHVIVLDDDLLGRRWREAADAEAAVDEIDDEARRRRQALQERLRQLRS